MLSRANQPMANFNRALRCVNEFDAFASLLCAAESGCLRAQFLVGLAYHTGRGVERDCERAARWYRKAAGRGDSYAITNLAVMSLLGEDGPADDVDAYTWLQSAVGLGHAWLRPALEIMERRVTGSGDLSDRDCILHSVSPEIPEFRPCTQPDCDPARCGAD